MADRPRKVQYSKRQKLIDLDLDLALELGQSHIDVHIRYPHTKLDRNPKNFLWTDRWKYIQTDGQTGVPILGLLT